MLAIGQEIKYTNGTLSGYSGKIVKITGKNLVVIDDSDTMELWNAGFAVGSCITESQIVNN